MEKNSFTQLINICKILKENGVNLKRLQLSRRENGKPTFFNLNQINQDGININKIIQENGLDGDFPIAKIINELRGMYNGRSNCRVSVALLEEAEELDIVKKETSPQTTLKVCKVLSENGVSIKKIQITKSGENKKTVFCLLKEIKQEGIDINKIIEENDLNPEFEIGRKIDEIRKIYNGSRRGYLSKKESEEAERLRIVKKESLLQETIRVCEVLLNNGISPQSIPLKVKNEDKNAPARWSKLSDLDGYNININRICVENNIDVNFVIGLRLSKARSIYNGNETQKMTKSERMKMEDLGIVKRVLTPEDIKKESEEKALFQKLREICKQYNISHKDISMLMKEKDISINDVVNDSEKREALILGIVEIKKNKEKTINNKSIKNKKDDKDKQQE